ncbi:MAG: hypothetical protein WBA12_09565, partial [Catalinimonas sp.]
MLPDVPSLCELHRYDPDAGERAVEHLTERGRALGYRALGVPPWWVKKVRRDLGSAPLHLVTTVGYPYGWQRTEAKAREAEVAVRDGAREVEITLNLMALHERQGGWIRGELARFSNLLHASEVLHTVWVDPRQLREEEFALLA